MNLIDKFFEDRKSIIGNWSAYRDIDNGMPVILIEEPSLLAGFVGYCKFQLRKKAQVYIRGQVKNYPIIPSLFRNYPTEKVDAKRIRTRIEAYNQLISEAPKLFDAERFSKSLLGPILQHYGIRTPYIDLVDNLFVATWFATHQTDREKHPTRFLPTDNDFGWLYLFRADKKIEYFDLRKRLSSLSLRLHSQHAISARKRVSTQNSLQDHICAIVKFPTSPFKGSGQHYLNQNYLFPEENLDNTYKYLRRRKFSELLSKIVSDNELNEGELGSIVQYN